MIALKAFDNNASISLNADVHIQQPDVIELRFTWVDKENKIVFSEKPIGGRHSGLWNQTCFEAFIKPFDGDLYYEINLSGQKAWNIFSFDTYRSPQPPRELASAVLQDMMVKPGYMSAKIRFIGQNFTHIKASLCAVIQLKDAGLTYWSHLHADQKPNFHHMNSLTIERGLA